MFEIKLVYAGKISFFRLKYFVTVLTDRKHTKLKTSR